MSIEIRQLLIRAVVERERTPPSERTQTLSKDQDAPSAVRPSTVSELDQDALVDTCVRRVLRELRRSRER